MTSRPHRVLALVLILALAAPATSRALSPGFPCRDCQGIADQCWQASADQFNSCSLDCFIPPPFGVLGIGLCLSGCEAAWIYRNAQCGANYLTCITVNQGCEEPQGTTPILVDMDRNNFHLAGFGDPVLFDLDADGIDEWTAWTRGDQADAFLCRDRNGNGTIDDGSELFGNNTPLYFHQMSAPNGYIALAELDAPSLGGNADGAIDAEDEEYAELCLWIDANHNGVSESGELSGLAAGGVESLSLSYSVSPRQDPQGNEFWYFGSARIVHDGKSKRTSTSDVFFTNAGD